MTPQPSAGTAEPPHLGIFISPACPPKAVSTRDRRCFFAARVEPSAEQMVLILRDLVKLGQSTRFQIGHHQMWSLLLQPYHAGCYAGASPLTAYRTTTADLVRSFQERCGYRPHWVRLLPAQTGPNPRLLAAVATVPEIYQ